MRCSFFGRFSTILLLFGTFPRKRNKTPALGVVFVPFLVVFPKSCYFSGLFLEKGTAHLSLSQFIVQRAKNQPQLVSRLIGFIAFGRALEFVLFDDFNAAHVFSERFWNDYAAVGLLEILQDCGCGPSDRTSISYVSAAENPRSPDESLTT